MQFFRRECIAEPFGLVPVIRGTRIGYMEILPGDNVCAWVVSDHLVNKDGMAGECRLVGKVVTPMAPMLFARGVVNAWLTHKGFNIPTPVGRNVWVQSPPLIM